MTPPVVSCKTFLDALPAGAFNGADDQVIWRRIASSVPLRDAPDQLHLTRDSGTTAVYVRRSRLRKALVSKSQSNRRRVVARRQLL